MIIVHSPYLPDLLANDISTVLFSILSQQRLVGFYRHVPSISSVVGGWQ
jgi:hypothetical protein